jgi:hypothetical protein
LLLSAVEVADYIKAVHQVTVQMHMEGPVVQGAVAI